VSGGRLRSELYIDSGDADQNVELFSRLAGRREEVETAYGRALEWDELQGRRACRIADHTPGDITNAECYDRYIDLFLETIPRWSAAIDRVRPALMPPPPHAAIGWVESRPGR
jgi:Domain of unknown function (DUF4268)